MEFAEALTRSGFASDRSRSVARGDAELFTAQPNTFMIYSVYAYDDGSAMFSWEFALGEYLARRGIQVGSDETLNQFMYPRQDLRGRQDGAWLVGAIEQTEAMLATLRFDRVES
jgi:hypothetical protein